MIPEKWGLMVGGMETVGQINYDVHFHCKSHGYSIVLYLPLKVNKILRAYLYEKRHTRATGSCHFDTHIMWSHSYNFSTVQLSEFVLGGKSLVGCPLLIRVWPYTHTYVDVQNERLWWTPGHVVFGLFHSLKFIT